MKHEPMGDIMAFSLRAVFNEVVDSGKAAMRMVQDFVAPVQQQSYSSGPTVNLASVFAGHEARAAARLAPAPVKMDGIKKGSPFGNAR